jgi:hypothetical protein
MPKELLDRVEMRAGLQQMRGKGMAQRMDGCRREVKLLAGEDGRGLLQSIPFESLERFGDALFVPGTIIAVGARTAPRFHLATAIVITALFVGLMCFSLAQATSMCEDLGVSVQNWLVGEGEETGGVARRRSAKGGAGNGG